MHVITQKRIREAKERWPQSASALDAWYRLMKGHNPANFAQLKALFPSADKVGRFIVFDIGGNKLRLIAAVAFTFGKVYIQDILNHTEYDEGKWKDR